MFKLNQIKKDVRSFAPFKDKFLYSKGDDLYDENTLIKKDIDGASIFNVGRDFIQIWDKKKGFYYYKENLMFRDYSMKLTENSRILAQSSLRRISFRNYESDILEIDSISFEIIKTIKKGISGDLIFYNSDQLILSRRSDIQSFSLIESKPEWQFNIEQLGTWQDSGEEKNYEIKYFIGAYKNQLILACSNSLIISIDIHTGKQLHSWQNLEQEHNINGNKINKLPRDTRSFLLDKEKGIVFTLDYLLHIEISLENQAIKVTDLTQEAERHKIIRFDTTFYTQFNTNLVFGMAKLLKVINGESFLLNAVSIFNRKTQKIEWFYTNNTFGTGTNMPQVKNKKLYILTLNKELYIFSKE